MPRRRSWRSLARDHAHAARVGGAHAERAGGDLFDARMQAPGARLELQLALLDVEFTRARLRAFQLGKQLAGPVLGGDEPEILGQLGLKRNDPRTTVRIGLGVLLALNIIAAWFGYSPLGGSAGEMETRLGDLRAQVARKQAALLRGKQLAAKVDKGRTQGDEFLGRYFLSRPTTYSTLVGELNQLAKAAGVRPKEQSFNEEEVEGSDELGMVSITAGYEGSYADLLHFLRELDRANRLVIIESLAASPQQGSGVLNISLRLNTFIRETPLPQVAALAPAAGGGQ